MKDLIKSLLPAKFVTHIWNLKQLADQSLIRIFSNANLLNRAYYFFFNKNFSFENKTVLAGRKEYYRRLKDNDCNRYLLRRNIHRLEKGMIMVPRRDLFAEKYIHETVTQFERMSHSNKVDMSEARWANDVLESYFKMVSVTKVTSAAKVVFQKAQINLSNLNLNPTGLSIPVPSSDFTIDFDVSLIEQLILTRKSTRWFQEKRVPENLIQEILSVSTSAPSACNRQPYRVIALSDDDAIASVSKLASGTSGFSHQIPNLLVWIGDLSAYPYERDRHAIFIDSSLAAMQFMLLCRGHNLETCMLNWPEIRSRDHSVGKILKLKEYERVVFLMAVGFPKSEALVPFSQKKEGVVTFK